MFSIQSMHADFYDLPDDTCYSATAKSPKKIKSLQEKVTTDVSEQSLQIISPILSSEGTGTLAESIISRPGSWAGGGDRH
jgi:hypothetical protein